MTFQWHYSGEVNRTKWKGVKDNRKKFQKQAESITGQSGKSVKCTRYKKWCWAEKVQFLENLCYGPSSKFNLCSTSLHDCSLDSKLPPAIQLVSSTSITATRMRKPEIVYVESSETLSKDTLPGLRYSTTARTTPAIEPDTLSKRRSPKAKRIYNESADDGHRPHLKRAKCGEPSGGIDFLFKSYAETFKRFTAKKQVLLKLTLAKLFANAELDEIEEPSMVFSSESLADEQDYSLGLDPYTHISKGPSDSDISSID